MITYIKTLIWIVIFGLSACSYPTYLPKIEKLGEDRFGSYIMIRQPNSKIIKGELISVENARIRVLVDSTNYGEPTIYRKMLSIDPLRMESYTVYFAKPISYEAFIPLLCLTSISHGLFAVFSLPINLISTIAIVSGERKVTSYKMRDINLDQLRMFARYPQGIPPGIDFATIK
jgi:hypothetical protein